MAVTDFGALSTAKKKVWATKLWMAGRDRSFWMSNGWVGSGQSDTTRPIHRVTELTRTERGDEAIMQLVADMRNDGVVGDNQLTGAEEPLHNESIRLKIDQIRHAVKAKGKMSEQRTVIRFRETARDKLSFKVADQLDELLFLTASGVSYSSTTSGGARQPGSQLSQLAFAADVAAPTTNRRVFAGTATSTTTLTASDKINWQLIIRARTLATRKKLKPIRSGGKDYFAIVMSTEQQRDLETDPTYMSLVAKAGPRGDSNPLFKNALAVVGGVILYSHNKTFNTLDATSGVNKWGAGLTLDGAQALLFGAQALGLALLGEPEMEESDINDYRNQPGISIGRMFGMVKPQFKSIPDGDSLEDFSLISIYTAAAAT